MESEPKNPSIKVETFQGQFVTLTWDNCVLRTFKEAVYNHVQWYDGENIFGFIAPQSIMDTLFENDFPNVYSPTTDQDTRDWYVGLMMDGLEADLATLGEET